MKFAAAIVLLFALAAVASARPVGLRTLLSRHGEEEKEPIYCTGVDYIEDECPEHYECAELKDKVCEEVEDCVENYYGNDNCTHEQQCWEFACVEIPMYCNVSYAGDEECVTKYGKDLKCKQLGEEECVDEEECKYVDTEKCKEYDYEEKCTDVDGDKCLIYNQERTCEPDQEVCKTYKEKKVCKPAENRCAKYYNGKCTEYEEDCVYEATEDCKTYETLEGKCTYVNTTCKKYEQVKKCEKVEKECKVYEQKEVCEYVDEVCWTGKCVKVEAPKKAGYTFGK